MDTSKSRVDGIGGPARPSSWTRRQREPAAIFPVIFPQIDSIFPLFPFCKPHYTAISFPIFHLYSSFLPLLPIGDLFLPPFSDLKFPFEPLLLFTIIKLQFPFPNFSSCSRFLHPFRDFILLQAFVSDLHN